jgi:hypothetical protein
MEIYMASMDNVNRACRDFFRDGSLKVCMIEVAMGMGVYNKGLCPPNDLGL